MSLIFPSTKVARCSSISGVSNMAGLIHKLVQPRKVVSSRVTNQIRFDEFLVAKTEAQMGTANATVLRKTNAAVGRKLGCFDLRNRGSDDAIKFRSLFRRDGSSEILDLGLVLSHENDQSDFGHARHP